MPRFTEIAIFSSLFKITGMLFLMLSCNGNDTVYEDFDYRDLLISELMLSQQQIIGDSQTNGFAWIELRNTSLSPVDLSRWQIREINTRQRFRFPDNSEIQPGHYRIVGFTNSQIPFTSSVSAGFELPDEGHLRLEDANGNLIDSLRYFPYQNHADISIIRYELGGRGNLYTIPSTIPSPGEANRLESWQYTESFQLSFPEPSGLALSVERNTLWSVSDNPGSPSIFEISKQGEVLRSVPFMSEDLEGITQNPADSTLWIVEERQRELIQLSTNGTVMQRKTLDIPQTETNSGLEGITINPANGHFFAVNTKLPRLFIELNSNAEMLYYKEINYGAETYDRGLDFSGLFYDTQNDIIWLISDEAESVLILDTSANLLAIYKLDVEKLEGIAVDRQNSMMYSVSDELERLYHFPLPAEFKMLQKPN